MGMEWGTVGLCYDCYSDILKKRKKISVIVCMKLLFVSCIADVSPSRFKSVKRANSAPF